MMDQYDMIDQSGYLQAIFPLLSHILLQYVKGTHPTGPVDPEWPELDKKQIYK